MACENVHMAEAMIMEPGLVMIFAHGVEWSCSYIILLFAATDPTSGTCLFLQAHFFTFLPFIGLRGVTIERLLVTQKVAG